MEDVAPQVASPLTFHQRMGGPFHSPHNVPRKRGHPFNSSNFVHQNHSNDWEPNSWGWDSARFVARPLHCDGGVLTEPSSVNANQLRDGAGKTVGAPISAKEPQPISRPNKKVRCGSPGSANYPICQVDDCKEDLSNAKDYHRRHKVCEVHSKAVKALVGEHMQRFCQQCSRFHPLSEFDEGKRSCRRRLAGHNRRRRKTQIEDNAQQSHVAGSRENNAGSENDIINLLSVLAHAQGNNEDRSGKSSSVPGSNELIQVLSRINSLPLPADLAAKLSLLKDANGSIPIVPSENQSRTSGNAFSLSTMDLLALFSAAHGVPNHGTVENQSHGSTEGSDSEKSKSLYVDQAAAINLQSGSLTEAPPFQGDKSNENCHSPAAEVYSHAQETSPNLSLQLFSSSPEDDANMGRKLTTSDRIFLSSDSSNPSGEGSPICSPPLVRDLFPMQTSREKTKVDFLSNAEVERHASTATDSRCSTSLRLFGGSIQVADAGSYQSSPNPLGYRSSASDNSPTTLNSDTKERTGRISFKLFDKDPSHLPGSLRTQILSWLSNSPTEIESYIRPGCVVLSLYLSMPSYYWDHLEENLHYYLNYLVKSIDVNFWGNGRFLVNMDRRMAFHNDGKVRLQKSWRAWNTPELISVSPIAVVPGQETSLLLRGRGLKSAEGTKIHCTHTDSYSIRETPPSSCVENVYEEVNLSSFTVNLSSASSSVLGRCFIEVENNFRGASFPLIIANNAICQELRRLDPEICDHKENSSTSRESALHFLDELGWLFQRKLSSSFHESPHYKIARFEFLLTFTVDHDFCFLAKTLLDILVELNRAREGLAVSESLSMLSEIHLLNRAVKRRCKDMVDLLVRYSFVDPTDATERYIFTPNAVGPGGLTPLHLAACTSSSEDLVDALTNDPQEIGLHSWNSALDENGISPYAYALMRNNHSYNAAVARKLGDRKNHQISVHIEKATAEKEITSAFGVQVQQQNRACSKCARRAPWGPRGGGLIQRSYIHSMLAVAAVCVCVCLIMRGRPLVDCDNQFVWENLRYGAM